MARQSIYFRPTIYFRPIYLRLARGVALLFALSTVSWTGLASTSEASILLQEGSLRDDSTLIETEQLIAELEEPGTSSSGASTSGGSSPIGAEDAPLTSQEDLAWRLAAMTSHTEGSTSGSSSSSTGSSSTSGGASLFNDVVVVFSDDTSVGRYASELALTLPDAPGTELLRPPQPLSGYCR